MTVEAVSVVELPDVYPVCEHEHRRPFEERWEIAEHETKPIGVCVCCWGPCYVELSPVSDYIPGTPESWGYIGNDSRCKRCPVEA
jgi:hypothetical protein